MGTVFEAGHLESKKSHLLLNWNDDHLSIMSTHFSRLVKAKFIEDQIYRTGLIFSDLASLAVDEIRKHHQAASIFAQGKTRIRF